MNKNVINSLFWFVIRLRIYEIDLWLGYHDHNYFIWLFWSITEK